MSPRTLGLWFLALLLPFSQLHATTGDTWAQGFAQPPAASRPWCFWYWFNGNISKEGITHDLEAMARVGIGEAMLADIHQPGFPEGPVKVLTDEWWGLVKHAIREGTRLGVDVSLFNCPGWSQSGGPWNPPEHAMRYLVSSEVRVTGPARFAQVLPRPAKQFQDVAVLAFPAPAADGESIRQCSPRVTCTAVRGGADKLIDGDLATMVTLAHAANDHFAIEITTDLPFTARSLDVYPGEDAFSADCRLEAADDAGGFRLIRHFTFDRANMNPNVGPMPRGPVTITFAPVTGTKFRISFEHVEFGRMPGGGLATQATLADVDLTRAPRVEAFVDKQLGKMHSTPIPLWNAYEWPTEPEPDSPGFAVAPQRELNLTSRLKPDGTLTWDVPAGDWIIVRTGMVPTGVTNHPSLPEGEGLEVDKLDRAAARAHFKAFVGRVLHDMAPAERRSFNIVAADSYEVGSQDWTDGFAARFQQRYGYDPVPWLPVLTGRIVASADQSDRFLWDLRRLVADDIAHQYVAGLGEISHENGLQLWLENYGHWGFAGEFLQYGGQADQVAGEFWTVKGLGALEVRAASSCANIYGKPIAAAESYTSGPKFQSSPWRLKALGDWAFTEGINRLVLAFFLHQPNDRKPGVNSPWPNEFNRNNTWFDAGRSWIDYLRRCSFLLQQGHRVTDVAYFIGEDAPKMTGIRDPELPPGHDYDFINAEVIEQRLGVAGGRLTLPDGAGYRILVLPPERTMRPAVLRKIRDLVRGGAVVYGLPPMHSPSMANYPACDREVQQLATELWGSEPLAPRGERSVGAGHVFWGAPLPDVLTRIDAARDFTSTVPLRFTHRTSGDADLYFLANPSSDPVETTAVFRVEGRVPELWWPDTGRIERPSVYEGSDGTVRLPLRLGPTGSVFVVFRSAPATKAPHITSVTRNGTSLLDAQRLGTTEPPASNFSLAMWVNPAVDTTLVHETSAGICDEPRNDVITAPDSDGLGGGRNAGCGVSVGRNGVVVFESSAGRFAPVLVYPTAIHKWTHVAIVYREGWPNLYVDGAFVHRGLHSDFRVHPGAGTGPGVMPFRGEVGNCRVIPRSLSDGELAALPSAIPAPGFADHVPPIELSFGSDGGIGAVPWSAGEYAFQFADGQTARLSVPSAPAVSPITGPWEVQFSPAWGGPAKITFDHLVDWTTVAAPGVKYYSGTAKYRHTFRVPELKPDEQLWLDLGDVRDLAAVRVNGTEIGTVWHAPWRIDITRAARGGENQLEVDVVNPWNNRLVRDAGLPPEKRLTWLLSPVVNQNSPLMPAGLLGPVTLQTAHQFIVPVHRQPMSLGSSPRASDAAAAFPR